VASNDRSGGGKVNARMAAALATDVDDAVCATRRVYRHKCWAAMPSIK
jgi:hypothetical protein